MRFLLFLFTLFLPFLLSLGEESFKTITVEVRGEGLTPKKAIEDALIEAIKRVYGVSLQGYSELNLTYTEKNTDENTVFSQRTDLQRRLSEKFKGFIESYTVENVNYDKRDGLYYAKVLVTVKKYVPPGLSPDTRRKLAIYPLILENTNLLFPKNRIEELFNQALTTVITHSRKFTVLDRSDKAVYYRELMEITDISAHPRELAKLGQRLGADYLLVGRINDLSFTKKTEGSKALGWYTEKTVLRYAISYKVIMFATGQVKYSNEITGEVEISNLDYPNLVKAFEKIAQRMEKDILYAIYPPRVIYVSGKTVIVDYGNKSLNEGDTFRVFSRVKKLYDPYTHEPLDYLEEPTGVVKIIETKPKYSVAVLIEGTAKVGDILRPYKEKGQKQRVENAKSDVKVLPGGGVKLPWDK